jgi:hypothetical protein
MARQVKNWSVGRLIRLQLKSGYITEAPPEYTFLQRYPPVFSETKPPVEEFKVRDIPAVRLYDKAVERNAVYEDERIYPAFWRQEPQALALARKQYLLMKKGLDEETAYVRAMRYVDELESKAYEETEKVFNVMKEKGAEFLFSHNESVMDEIFRWRARLKEIRYSKLQKYEQGELDEFILSKILQWGEMDKERRMKDPIFHQQFERLRAEIFPEIDSEATIEKHEQLTRARQSFKIEIFKKYQINDAQLSPALPFFLEDFRFYFEKLRIEPDLNKWPEPERAPFYRWIVSTLAIREILKNGSSTRVQAYLDDLRVKFFPMVKYPERVNKYVLPDIQGLKALLYQNDIGYKKQGEKVMVRRFYRLPALLFPEETAEPTAAYAE